MRKFTLFTAILFLLVGLSYAQEKEEKKGNTKSGFSWGALPAIAYDSDTGLRYGALAELYDYGDGTLYPKYKHKLYIEWSRTTKGSGNNILKYDSEYLIPNVRLTAEASLITEQTLDFYGFNGYEAVFNPNFADQLSDTYKTRVYYRHDRKLTRIKADFQGQIIGKKLRWLAGVTYFGAKIADVDTAGLNKDKVGDDRLPFHNTLYADYIANEIIPTDQINGGGHGIIKTGLVFDTRDNEPNPQKGIWTEALLMYAPSFLSTSDYTFAKMAIIHRQYFTLVNDVLSFAYRLDYQPKIAGEIPFYMLPIIHNSKETQDGLGGSKTLRGVYRNRVVGDDMFYTNFELRWKVFKTTIGNSNFYLGANAFADAGRVTGKYEFNNDKGFAPVNENETFHGTYGFGTRFVLNENFIIAVDYGIPLKEADGSNGLYIGLNYLF